MMFEAAVLLKQNQKLQILSLASQLPQAGQVKVKLLSAGLCGAQLNEISGVKGPDKFLPHLMGHEGFGVVLAIGTDVTRVTIGDYVVLHWRKASGKDVFGGVYDHAEVGKIGSGPVTTFSEETIVSENRVTPITPNIELGHLYPLLGCALTTAYGIITKEAKPDTKDNILIVGAGGLGISIGLLLQVSGFSQVSLVEKTLEKLEGVIQNSADLYSSLSEVEDNSFDFVFDTTGIPSVLSMCFDKLRKGGRLVLVGQPRIDSELLLKNPLKFFDGISIFASDGGGFCPDKDMANVQSIVENNSVIFDRLISHQIGLAEVNDGFDLMLSGEARRVIINFGS